MFKRIIIGLVTVVLSFNFVCLSNDFKFSGTASEMYIKGFQEHFNSLSSKEQSKIVSDINDLGRKFEVIMDSTDYYIGLRNGRIASLRNLPAVSTDDKQALNRALIEEYIHCSFDSAFSVGRQNLDLATSTGIPEVIAESKVDLAKIFIQGGYFREAAEQLDGIGTSELDDEHQIVVLMARFFLEFENGFFFAWNQQNPDMSEVRMKALYLELIRLLPDDAYEIYQLKSKLSFYKHHYVDATGYCDILLLKDSNPESWNYIHALGDMGYNKLGAHDYVAAMEYMVKSGILAVRRGALNNPALRKIAELVHVVGNDKLASKLINKSIDNAMEYNSKYRIIESAKGYPMINRHLQERVRRDHHIMVVVAIIMAVMVILLSVSLWYSRKQHKKVEKQADIISHYNETLRERNEEIESTNEKLSEVHGVTSILASKMMNGASMRRELVEKLRKDVSLKLKVRQYDDLSTLIESFRKEMQDQYLDIDEILLAFFPTFAEQFNKLLKEENRFECKQGLLPPEIRIFALWRIGLKKNENVARCMGYSLNTIKSYKTKVINSSLYEKEEFYQRLMQIKVDING